MVALALVAGSAMNVNHSLKKENASMSISMTLKGNETLAQDEQEPNWDPGFIMGSVECWTGGYIYIFGLKMKVYEEYNECEKYNENSACDRNQEQAHRDDCR